MLIMHHVTTATRFDRAGGQKARIALARACYRGADIYILDDVLAAVDVHVGKHLFKKCICGAMAGSTRILVTNALHVLPSCDSVSVVDNGTVAESGADGKTSPFVCYPFSFVFVPSLCWPIKSCPHISIKRSVSPQDRTRSLLRSAVVRTARNPTTTRCSFVLKTRIQKYLIQYPEAS
jgi:energy-coupling factor transporter ATP-binding protein EcfA2